MKTLRILLVDDEVEFATILAKVLRRRGFEVEAVSNGGDALEAIARGGFAVTLLDVKMPGKDGIQVLKEIKDLSPTTQAILMTGHQSVAEEKAGMQTGAFAYVLKPHPIPDLVSLIEKAAAREQDLRGSGSAEKVG